MRENSAARFAHSMTPGDCGGGGGGGAWFSGVAWSSNGACGSARWSDFSSS